MLFLFESKDTIFMNELPLVTIVTPSYNQGRFLERTILSVLEQDYPNIEYMVIDGGSTDQSVDIIKKYSDRLAYSVSEKDKGQSDAINKGWKRSKGVYCCYLNSDDALYPGAISTIVAAFLENPRAGIIYGDYTFINENDDVLELVTSQQIDFKRLLIDGQMPTIAQPSSFYLTSLVRELGYLDEKLHLSMDYDLILKLSSISELAHVPRQISYFRLHGASKTSSFAKAHWHETLKVRMKYNKILAVKSILIYFRFRLFHLLPKSIKVFLRTKRASIHDKIILNSEK
jgi:glycosyltransferase involved in cell wall biosynthesis